MTINYQFGDVDAHGAMIRALAGLLEAEHQAIISDVLTASDFWGGAGSAACQGFITQLGRNFQVIYETRPRLRCRRLTEPATPPPLPPLPNSNPPAAPGCPGAVPSRVPINGRPKAPRWAHSPHPADSAQQRPQCWHKPGRASAAAG